MQKVNKSAQISKNEPSERNSASLTYDARTETLYLLGGADQTETLADLRSYDLSNRNSTTSLPKVPE